MSGFLSKRVVPPPKCVQCLIYKKKLCKNKVTSVSLKKEGTGDILFIFEMEERPHVLEKFMRWLKKNQINNYEIMVGLQCTTNDFVIPSPYYKTFARCDTITDSSVGSKVIVPIGRAITSVTKNDDIVTWQEFQEYQFNQTYFYTPYYWGKRLRVYPLPSLIDWVDKSNFESFFALKQLSNIKSYLSNYSNEVIDKPKLIKIEEPNDFLRQYQDDELELGWDTETSGLDHFIDDYRIGCITMSFNGKEGYYLPYDKINKRLLSAFLKNKYQILANGKFDLIGLERDGVRNCRVDEDVTLLYHVLNTDRMFNGLKSLAWLIGYGGYEDGLVKYLNENKIDNFLDIPDEIMFPYSTLDAVVTYELYQNAKKNLIAQQPRVYEAYKKYIIPSIPAFTKMQINGILVSQEKLKRLNDELSKELQVVAENAFKITGYHFDINSPDQVAKVFEKEGLPCHGRTEKKHQEVNGEKVGLYQVGDAQLQKWKKQGYQLATEIMTHRSLAKLQSSFVGEKQEEKEEEVGFVKRSLIDEDTNSEGLTKFIKSDGRIHASIDPGRTSTLRSAASNPNVQQLPKQGPEGKRFRPIFTVPEDYLFCEADYSGFQLRIVAILSKDKTMEDIFVNKNGDMHSVTAVNVFCRDMSIEDFLSKKGQEPYKTFRFMSKGVNFGFCFGRSSFGFRPDIEENWTDDQVANYIKENQLEVKQDQEGADDLFLTVADDLRNKYFDTYKSLPPWIESQHQLAKTYGYVDNWHGGRRHLPFMRHIGKDTSRKEISGGDNVAVNSPVQTFEAFEVYEAVTLIHNEFEKRGLKSYLISMIHDSIGLCVHKNEIEEVYYILKNSMEKLNTWDIPITIEIEMGEVWGFSHEITEKNLKEFAAKNKI